MLCLAPCLTVRGEEQSVTLDPSETRIEWSLQATGHVVRGHFDLLSGQISWNADTGEAWGLIEIDATSATTGNERRDAKMHRDVLESDRHPRFVYRPTGIEGAPGEGKAARVVLRGILTVRGEQRPLEIPAVIERRGEALLISATFRVPYVTWGMEDPSVLLLRVAKEVEVGISATARLDAPPSTNRGAR